MRFCNRGGNDVCVAALSSVRLSELDFHKTDVANNYISYRFEINGDEITVFADAFAKYVEIDSPDSDLLLSDNYFDLNGGQKTVKILSGNLKNIRLRSVYDIQ